MISDRLFVYGTLMRGFDHPMAQLLSRSADYLGPATCRGRLYLIKHYPGLVLSDEPADIVFGELYRLRDRDALLGEFDMYEACGAGFPEPTEYVRRMLQVTHRGRHGKRGVDLRLQLARHRPAADRLGEVFGAVGRLPNVVLRHRCVVIRGLDPRIHGPRLLKRMDGAGQAPAVTRANLPRIQPLALHPYVHLALDIAPFFGRAQRGDQFLERSASRGRVFEPGQEVEGLAEVAAVIELAGDRRQIFQAARDVVRLVLERSAAALPASVPTTPRIS